MLRVNRNALNVQANNVQQANDLKGGLMAGGGGGGNEILKQPSKTPSPPKLKSYPLINLDDNDEYDIKKAKITTNNTTTALNNVTSKQPALQTLQPLQTLHQQQQALQQKRVSRIPKPISFVTSKALEKESLADEQPQEPPIEDIDQNTSRDAVFMVCDVAKDIYQYMFELEQAQAIDRDFLKDQKIFTPKVRQRLVNWCLDIHIKLKLIPETLYVAISIIDRYFNIVTVKQQSQVQLVAAGAFLIASKYEEIYPPELNDLIILTANAYTRRDIMRIEIEILEKLNFDLGKPIPLAFLRRFSKAAHCDLKMHSISKFLMEMSLTEYECSHWAPSLLAATALFTTIHLVQYQHENQTSSLTTTNSLASFGLTKRLGSSSASASSLSSAAARIAQQQAASQWNKQLIHYTQYSREQLLGPAAVLCKIIKRFFKNPGSFSCYKRNAVNLARWPELKSGRVDELIKLGELSISLAPPHN